MAQRKLALGWLIAVALVANLVAASVRADDEIPPDVVVLNSGGQLQGEITEQKVGNRTIIVVKRNDGSVIELAKDQVKYVRRPKEVYAEYLARKSTMQNTIDAHWEMSQWCRDHLDNRLSNGPTELGPERTFHLQAILRLDPDHKQARAFLGYVKKNGVWVNVEQQRLGHGFVRYDKRWMTREEVALEESNQAWQEEQIAWTRRLKKMHSGDPNDAAVRAEFDKIDAPAAIEPLVELLAGEKNEDWQLRYIDALGNIHSAQAARTLCDVAVGHANSRLQERAITRLKLDHVDKGSAARYVANQYLHSEKNELINRAGFVLGELGDFSVVEPLIDALVTVHIVPNPRAANPGALTTTFSNQGNGLSSGSSEPKMLQLTQQNESVANALRQLTGADFGFDKQDWRDWYAQEHTLTDIDVRRDE